MMFEIFILEVFFLVSLMVVVVATLITHQVVGCPRICASSHAD